jgi:hypothetical protein
VVDRNEVFFAPPTTSLTISSLQKKKKMMVTISSMEPSPSFSLVLVKERQKIEVFFCQQKGVDEFCVMRVLWKKRKTKEKKNSKKRSVHSMYIF